MSVPVLATKLYIPPPRPKIVLRPRLIKRLNEGLAAGRKLTIISASAGFGKTTLLSEWISPPPLPGGDGLGVRAAWLSLDEGDSAPARFLTYLIAALQTIEAGIGEGIMAALQSPQPPPPEALLTGLLNEIAAITGKFILVLDDYHAIESQPVDKALTFLVEHLPPQMHLVIATREDPPLPLARFRARNQLTELRAADLRFTPAEAAEFLNRVMGLNLSAEDVAALEARTEGWIAGLQLAALALQGSISAQGPQNAAGLIQSFTGSHHFVLDYLLEEVLHQQSESIQTFLLRTSILERLCGPHCEAMLCNAAGSGQETLEFLERANLFIVPLDNERRWYRYHHLFGDLLRKRLGQSLSPEKIIELHVRASEWLEKNGLAFEAFHHATEANDVERAERLIGSKDMALHFRSVSTAVLNWLDSLPQAVLEVHPQLFVRSATLSLLAGRTTGVEEKLQAAEKILQTPEADAQARDLLGQIACARATLALTHYDPENMIIQARRALEYLRPENLTFRFTANWTLSTAYLFRGERAAAAQASQESMAISQKSGNVFSMILSTNNLGLVLELENQLHLAAETYLRVPPLFGDYPQPNAEEAYLGLARIYYEWNDLEAAEQYGQRGLQMARLYDRVIDRFIINEVFLARLKLARGDVDGAAASLAQVEQAAHQQNFLLRLPEIAAAQVLVLLKQGQTATAAELAQQFELPISQARVLLAQGDPSAALAILEPFRQQMEARGWADERLRAMVLQAVAFHLGGKKKQALQVLGDALTLAEPEGFIRLFVDEGEPMRLLIADFRIQIEKQAHDPHLLAYAEKLLTAFTPPPIPQSSISDERSSHSQSEILSPRELEILDLIAEGLTNGQIANRLYLSLYTVKAHVRNIFGKLRVSNRTQAVARARELEILQRT